MIRTLHWSLVFCIVLAYASAYYRYWYTTQMEPANWYLLVVHINVGLLIFVLSSILLILRVRFVKGDENAAPTKTLPAKIMHFALYFMLFSLPVSAYLGTGFDIPVLGVVNFPGFFRLDWIEQLVQQNLEMLMITFMQPFANYHRDIGADMILPMLLLGHIGAAIIHQRIK